MTDRNPEQDFPGEPAEHNSSRPDSMSEASDSAGASASPETTPESAALSAPESEPGLPNHPPASSLDIEPNDRPLYTWPPPREPLVAMEPPPPLSPPPPRLLPNFGHTIVFAILAFLTLFAGGIITFLVLRVAMRIPTHQMLERVTHSVACLIAAQAVWYGLLWALAAILFSLWWGTSFSRGIYWNAGTARRWLFRLIGVGIVTGIVITLAGNFVPIPKATPILKDIKASTASAWALMIFGITLAPLTEELAFRGFLLPSLINIFRWMERRRMIGESMVRGFGIPLSIVLTSALFAMVHAAQVSHAWGPILLIGLVSVVLCIVRLRTSSVACSVVVHATYNLMLFSALLIQTDFFRHLDKLKG